MAPGISRVADLRFEQRLGRGFFGEVLRAKDVRAGSPGTTFAVKKVKLDLVSENKLTDQLQREIHILYSLQHPRIVKLHFDFNDGAHMYLGMEFVDGGTLFDRLSEAGKFPLSLAARYFLEMCEALDYLHHLPEKVIHRDIKPENILLDANDSVKLADFGWANLLDLSGKRDTFCGTLDYLAPEMIMGTGHDESVDMWCMGVLLYELTTGKSPFGSSSNEATCRMILNVELCFPTGLDENVRDLVLGLCKKKKAERLAVRDAMAHRFITQTLEPAKRIEEAFTLGAGEGKELVGRPSVVVQRLYSEREQASAELEQMLKAKKETEEKLLLVTEELEKAQAQLREEQSRRAALEARCAELEERGSHRAGGLQSEATLVELRGKAAGLEEEVAKLRERREARRARWWGRQRDETPAPEPAAASPGRGGG